jgi:hypothetical protein
VLRNGNEQYYITRRNMRGEAARSARTEGCQAGVHDFLFSLVCRTLARDPSPKWPLRPEKRSASCHDELGRHSGSALQLSTVRERIDLGARTWLPRKAHQQKINVGFARERRSQQFLLMRHPDSAYLRDISRQNGTPKYWPMRTSLADSHVERNDVCAVRIRLCYLGLFGEKLIPLFLRTLHQ